jgi:hypothetical protein
MGVEGKEQWPDRRVEILLLLRDQMLQERIIMTMRVGGGRGVVVVMDMVIMTDFDWMNTNHSYVRNKLVMALSNQGER